MLHLDWIVPIIFQTVIGLRKVPYFNHLYSVDIIGKRNSVCPQEKLYIHKILR